MAPKVTAAALGAASVPSLDDSDTAAAAAELAGDRFGPSLLRGVMGASAIARPEDGGRDPLGGTELASVAVGAMCTRTTGAGRESAAAGAAPTAEDEEDDTGPSSDELGWGECSDLSELARTVPLVELTVDCTPTAGAAVRRLSGIGRLPELGDAITK